MTNARSGSAETLTPRLAWAPSLHQVGLTVILSGIFVASLAPYLNTDLWWHLRTGQMIVSSGSIPDRDTLSFTADGARWLNHEWLAEVAFFKVHEMAGILGLLIVVASIVTAAFSVMYIRMRVRGASPLIALVVLVCAWIASINSIYLRIQPFTLLLLAVYLLLLDEFRRTARRKLLLPLPALMLLWANVHGGFAVGLAVIVIALVGAALDRRSGNSSLGPRDIRALLVCLIASTLASLATPGGLETLLYPFRFVTPNFFTENINESQRPGFADPISLAFELLLLGLIASALVRKKPVSWADALLILGFTHLGLSQLRHMSVFAFAAAPVLAGFATDAMSIMREGKAASTLRPAGRGLAALHITILLAALLVLGAIASQYLSEDTLRSVEHKDYPAAACDFLRSGEWGTNIIADYRWGGYILWNLGPPFRTFIDGRADTVFAESTFRTYLRIFSLQPGWEAALRNSAADLVLVEPQSRLAAAISNGGEWKELYRDAVAVVFGRDRSSNDASVPADAANSSERSSE